MRITRRDLFGASARMLPALGGAGLALAGLDTLIGPAATSALDPWLDAAGLQDLLKTAPRARFWTTAALAGSDCLACHTAAQNLKRAGHTHNPKTVTCLLCARRCAISDGQRGMCRARANVGGELRSLVYGRAVSVSVDPIEKKPFFHFLPGSTAYSFGTAGCPLRCKFCQNWQLSQASPEDFDEPITPASTLAADAARVSPTIAFTYNEPTVFTEYLLEIAAEARRRKVRAVMVSCGFMNEAPLSEICRSLDAIKIDLKGYSESFYRTACGAELQPVLRSIRQIAKSGVHLEIVNLVVPTLNDSDTSLRELAGWVAGELGPDVPVHFTRFHPDYQLLNLPPTPIATLERARSIAMDRGINYAYVGNVPGHPGNNTYCPSCKQTLIERTGFFVTTVNVKGGRCVYCKRQIAGVWEDGGRGR